MRLFVAKFNTQKSRKNSCNLICLTLLNPKTPLLFLNSWFLVDSRVRLFTPHSVRLCYCWLLSCGLASQYFLEERPYALCSMEWQGGPSSQLTQLCCRRFLTKWKYFGISMKILKWDILRKYTILVLFYFSEIS